MRVASAAIAGTRSATRWARWFTRSGPGRFSATRAARQPRPVRQLADRLADQFRGDLQTHPPQAVEVLPQGRRAEAILGDVGFLQLRHVFLQALDVSPGAALLLNRRGLPERDQRGPR